MTYRPSPLKKIFHDSRRILSKYWLGIQPALQIAITGSHGKTSTTNVLAKTLSSLASTVSTDLNMDTNYNVPITALKVYPWTKFVIFELGIDHPGEMEKHLEIVRPVISIITGIAPVHADKEHLGSLENIIKEKRKVIEALPANAFAILNYDDINVRNMAPYTKARIIWYGTDPKKCPIWVDPKSIILGLNGTKFIMHANGTDFPVTAKLIGKQHIYTAMAVVSALQAIQKTAGILIPISKFLNTIITIEPLNGRMSIESGPQNTVFLNDSLRANPESTRSGLETLSEINYKRGNKIAVLAEMGELEHPQIEHEKIGRIISSLHVDYLLCIGPWQQYTEKEAVNSGMKRDKVFWAANAIKGAEKLKNIISDYDLIYLKGSVLRHVERVKLILEGTKVGCNVTLCPFYHNCLQCPYRESGYQNKI